MDAKELGRWAFLIALVVAVIGGLLAAFGMDTLTTGVIAAIVGVLAFLGGLLYISQGDRTEFFIVTLTLIAAAAWAADGLDLFGVGQYVAAILAGAAGVAGAAAAGALLVVIYEWIMP